MIVLYFKIGGMNELLHPICHFRDRSWNNGIPDSKIHGANMGPTWVLSAPDGPHIGPMKFSIWDAL